MCWVAMTVVALIFDDAFTNSDLTWIEGIKVLQQAVDRGLQIILLGY